MKVILKPINLNQKDLLKKMLITYEQELTGEKNPSEYKYLDSYWEKDNRKAYFIISDCQIVGFALVNQHRLIQTEGYNFSEFYVINEFRNKGIGKKAALKVFDLIPGKWEIREISSNTKAHLFWNKTIDSCTNGNYSEVWLDNDQWHGWVQTFTYP